MIPMVSESALTLEFLRADGFSLETPFLWAVQVAGQWRDFPSWPPPEEISRTALHHLAEIVDGVHDDVAGASA